MGFVAGCAGAPPRTRVAGHPPIQVGQEFILEAGDSARIGDTNLVLMFDSVSEDSRCPRDVACIWEGNARLKLILREYASMDAGAVEVLDENLELNTSGRFAQRRKIPVGSLLLRALAPVPPLDTSKKYVATLVIEAAP